MAKRFRFRLEQVLSLRKQVEELRIRELALAKGELLKIEEALKEHAEEEKAFLGRYGDFEKTGAFNSDEAMTYCQYKDWLLRREKEYRRREQEWMKEVERRRLAVVKSSRERRLLENLKEKQLRTHAQEVLGEEQRFLDEVSSIAFVRRARALQLADVHENLGR
ncbi:MAG TPA: flagellar export protein FliJ [bacterium]|nr:flagellar export protein FliJ [bacterium]